MLTKSSIREVWRKSNVYKISI